MAKRTKNRWRHPNRKYCFCFKRSDSTYVYTSVFGRKQSTDLVWNDYNKDEAMQILDYRLNQYLLPHEEKDLSINDVFQKFAAVHYGKYTKTNRQRYNNAFKSLLSKNHHCEDIEAIRSDVLINMNKKLETLSDTYVHKMLSNLKKIFDFGVSEEYLSRNPIKKAMFPSGGKKARRLFFTEDEINTIIDYCREKRGHEFGDLLEFLSIVGTRINEPLQGKREDIDLKNKQILIRDFKRANKDLGQEYMPRYIDIEVMDQYTNLSELLERMMSRDNGDKYFRWNSYSKLEYKLRVDMQHLNLYIPNRNFHAIRKFAINKFIWQGFPISMAASFFGNDEAVMKKYYLEIMGPKKFKEFVQNSMKNVHNLPSNFPVK